MLCHICHTMILYEKRLLFFLYLINQTCYILLVMNNEILGCSFLFIIHWIMQYKWTSRTKFWRDFSNQCEGASWDRQYMSSLIEDSEQNTSMFAWAKIRLFSFIEYGIRWTKTIWFCSMYPKDENLFLISLEKKL